GPGVRRVAPGALEVALEQAHECTGPAHARSFTLDRDAEDLVDVERHDVTHKRIAPKPMVRAPTVPQMMRIVMAMTHIIRCHQRIGVSSNWTCAHAAHILLIASPCSCSCCRMRFCHRIRC